MTYTTALITGGAGFIGSFVAEHLLSAGSRVVALDNLSTGSLDNLEDVTDHAGFRFVQGDVCDPDLVAALVRDADVVYHLAAAVGVRNIIADPVKAIETNITGTELLLREVSEDPKPILIASTSEVYGKNTAASFSEDDDLVFGSTQYSRWSYACSKAIDEFLSIAYHRRFGLPVVVVRLFNTVGPRQTGHYGMVVPRFVGQAFRNEPITVYGDGTQTRTFTHVADAVRAIYGLMEEPSAVGDVYNVGGTEEISILDLAHLVRDRAGSSSEIKLVPYDEAFGVEGFEDMPRRVPDLRKIGKLIGYEPLYSLDQIVDEVIDHFRANPSFE